MFKNTDDTYQIKIVDFGLAAPVNEKEHLYTRCGTPGFVGPEIISLKNG